MLLILLKLIRRIDKFVKLGQLAIQPQKKYQLFFKKKEGTQAFILLKGILSKPTTFSSPHPVKG